MGTTVISAIRCSQILPTQQPEFILPVNEGAGNGFASLTKKRNGISAYWRKNTSSVEPVELANLLRALRKVVGHLGDNAGRIAYTGMSTVSDNAILIEPEMVMGVYPLPVEQVDLLVGLIVHEALHRIEWTDHVWKILEPSMGAMAPLEKVIFQKIVRTGEDIFVDQKADQSVFGLYVKVARDKALHRERKMIAPTDHPSVDELELEWLTEAFDIHSDRKIRIEYRFFLEQLNFLTLSLRSLALKSIRVIKRCEKRADLYLAEWQQLGSRMLRLKIIDKHLCWFPSTEVSQSAKEYASVSQCKSAKKMTPLLAQEIETHLSADAVDMTPIIQSVVGAENETVAPMSRWDFNIVSHPMIDRRMVGRLKAIFSNYAERNFLVSRGLFSGKIDHRRLYRSAVTGRCFKAAERLPNLDWNVALLIDASGSMRGNKWLMVENTVANIHKALSGFHNRLSAWAYFEVNGICMISRLIQKNHLFSVPPSGQTASGQAIIVAATMLPANVKRNILIHITDGESNFGCDVSYGIEYCRQQKIHLITLGCGYQNKTAMQKQYGRAIQFIDYFEQLPKAMESLFKWTFIYGGHKSCKGPLVRVDSARQAK